MKAWHFMADDGAPVLRDGKRPPPIGVALTYSGPVVICGSGLHASRRIIDALAYAPGPWIARVELEGVVEEHADKAVGRKRTILSAVNGDRLLHEFALIVARKALKKADVTDKRCWDALDVKRRWMDGRATNEELEAAEAAIRVAAEAAIRVRAATWTAARAIAWDAARAASYDVAWYAAWAASQAMANVAAWNAAWDAERDWQDKLLERMVERMVERPRRNEK